MHNDVAPPSSVPRRSSTRPVFVDDSGRRHSLLRATAVSAGALLTILLALLALAAVGPMGVPSPWAVAAAGPSSPPAGQ